MVVKVKDCVYTSGAEQYVHLFKMYMVSECLQEYPASHVYIRS